MEYPRDVASDFNKLRMKTLKKYAWFFNLPTSNLAGHAELAAACAIHFREHLDADEETTLVNFTSYFMNLEKGKGENGESTTKKSRKREREKEIKYGNRVAAKINGEWMLTTVVKFKKRAKTYKVEDADELTENPAQYEVQQDHVLQLPEADEPNRRMFPRGSRVLALFPGTSTFYAATVAQRKEKVRGKAAEYGLRFDDDDINSEGNIKVKRVRAQDVVELTE